MMWLISAPLWILGAVSFVLGLMATVEFVRLFNRSRARESATAFQGIAFVMFISFVALYLAAKAVS